MARLLQYDNCDVEIDECKRIAAELRASGKYRRVVVRKRGPSERRLIDGIWTTLNFGRVYVEADDQNVQTPSVEVM